jgi:hypothetical protein
MINLSFLEQYGPLGSGLKGNMKMAMEELCFPDFTIDEGSRLINNDTPFVQHIGLPPSVTIKIGKNNHDKLIYLPTESICRLKEDLGLNAHFYSGNGYTVISQNRISIPTGSFARIDPCGTGDEKAINLSTTTVAISLRLTGSNILFYDQNGKELNAMMRNESAANGLLKGSSTFIFDVYIYYDTKQINVVKGPEN